MNTQGSLLKESYCLVWRHVDAIFLLGFTTLLIICTGVFFLEKTERGHFLFHDIKNLSWVGILLLAFTAFIFIVNLLKIVIHHILMKTPANNFWKTLLILLTKNITDCIKLVIISLLTWIVNFMGYLLCIVPGFFFQCPVSPSPLCLSS